MEKGPSEFAKYWVRDELEVSHFNDHAKEFDYDKIIQYSVAAKKFVENEERGIKSFKAYNGSIYKYNPRTNEFAIISKNGKIVTYFKPTGGNRFIYNKFDEYGDYWLS